MLMNSVEQRYGYAFSNVWQPCLPSWQTELLLNEAENQKVRIIDIKKFMDIRQGA